MIPRCAGCGMDPNDDRELQLHACSEGYGDARAFIRHEDGTFNKETWRFWCDDCYIKAGEPLGVAP